MLISYHWLKKFTPLKATPEEVAEKITLNLVEVESLTRRGEDTILEIENKGITNRPDCFSHLGMAREVAAYFNLPLKNPLKKWSEKKLSPKKKTPFSVKVVDSQLCPRYGALLLTGLKVSDSPKWLRVALENLGIRSINNVVDVTNYLMLQVGQPLHAFDYDKIEGKKIIVRRAKKGEEIVTLDGVKRKLNPDILVIADERRPIGVAGIKGGANTEVGPETKTIVLEAANFEPTNNRVSAKFLKLRTEASTRFEKGLDINLVYPALMGAAELLKKTAGGEVASPVFDRQFKKIKPWPVEVKPAWINRFLGLDLSLGEMRSILARLQLKTKIKKDSLIVTVPTFRPDLKMEADIAEEIARIYGYDKIPITLPKGEIRPGQVDKEIVWRKRVKQLLKGWGFSEVYTHPLVGRELVKKAALSLHGHFKLVNPLSQEREYLRRSLIPSILEAVEKNLYFFEEIKIFEIARIFFQEGREKRVEKPILIAAITGKDKFYQAKGVVEALFDELGIKNYHQSPITKPASQDSFGMHQSPIWHPTRTAEITKDKKLLGVIGEIHPQVLANFNLSKRVTVFNLDVLSLIEETTKAKSYTPLLKYPPIIEDLCFIVPPKTPVGKLLRLIEESSSIIRSAQLVDSFKDQRTIRVTFQDPKKTLTEEGVGKIREKIIKKVEEKFKASLKA